jgi:hypothetical protein
VKLRIFQKFHDIFQSLLNVKTQQENEKENAKSNGNSSHSNQEELSKMELISNAFILLVGG